MDALTLDMLLDELKSQVSVPDAQGLRLPVLNLLRHRLFRRIGKHLVGQTTEQMVTLINGRIEVPDPVLAITDASVDGYVWSAIQLPLGMGQPHHLTMVVDPYGVSFPFCTLPVLWIRCNSLATDETGTPLIPSAIYAACYEFCLGHLLASHPQHPRFAERYRILDAAERLIAESRVELLHESNARDRADRTYLG